MTPPASDAAVAADSSIATDAEAPHSDAAVATGKDASMPTTASPCSFSVSGGITDPTTPAPYGCGNSQLEQANGSGDYTINVGAGLQGSANGTVSLACTISSATPPAAGAKWVLSKDLHQGNCQLNAIKGTTATSWLAAANDATLLGGATISFVSATLMHGTVHPENVYYTYELTLGASLPGQTAGAADVKIQGHFQQATLVAGD